MSGGWAVFRREWRGLWISPIPWAASALFLFLAGLFYFASIARFRALTENTTLYAAAAGRPELLDALNLNAFVLGGFFRNLLFFALFLVPVLTMRTFAAEREQGTDELLLSSPIGPFAVVAGKFAGLAALTFCWLPAAAFYVLLTWRHASPEVGPVATSFLGLALALAACVSVSLAVAAWTRSAVVAAVGGFVVLLLLYVMEGIGRSAGGPLEPVLAALSMGAHYAPLLEGRLRLVDITYFLALTALGLFTARAAWAGRRDAA